MHLSATGLREQPPLPLGEGRGEGCAALPMADLVATVLAKMEYANLSFSPDCTIIKNDCSQKWCNMNAAADILFGKTRQAVLAVLFEQPDQGFYVRELQRLTGISPGALQHELARLLKADLIERREDGNRVHYQANRSHPLFSDLQSIVHKCSFHPAARQTKRKPPQMAVQPIAEKISSGRLDADAVLKQLERHKTMLKERFGVIDLALFGSVSRNAANSESDLDILVTFQEPATSKNYFGLQFYLEDLFGLPVDLVTRDALRPELKPYIEKDLLRV
jgi:predicted nucleotidyltransferase/DNA-binding HxlR family transcriptional regulator